MQIEAFKTLWGHTDSLETAALLAKDANFAGLEGPAPVEFPARDELEGVLRGHGLKYIAEISATGFANPTPGATVEDQLEDFSRRLEHALPLKPIFATTMAGSDLWSFADSVRFLTAAWEKAQSVGLRVGFETHRSRSLFHPMRTMELLAELPPIDLTLDFSHWCVVTERLVLDELPEVLATCADRALHLHARIGYDQGPQVPDPRAPEYQPAVDAHLRWWQAIWASQARRGFSNTTFTPEFGPDGYLHSEPFTQRPVGDLWDLNLAAASIVRFGFRQWENSSSSSHADLSS